MLNSDCGDETLALSLAGKILTQNLQLLFFTHAPTVCLSQQSFVHLLKMASRTLRIGKELHIGGERSWERTCRADRLDIAQV
jgi:hypothetical protein